MLTHGSLFSGIGGFDLGFERAGFRTLWAVEKEPFCRAVLATHFPETELLNDVHDCGRHNLRAVDVITAGFPCQDLSVAGKRAGLAGTRSGLFWQVVRIMGECRPPWFVLENVPGLFSSNEGRDFATVLNELDELGYGVAWRVLDSQFFGVAQRRRRVFIVGRFGAPCPAEVLFESESGTRDFAESGETWQDVAAPLTSGIGVTGSPAGRRREDDINLAIVGSLDAKAKGRGYSAEEAASGRLIVGQAISAKWAKGTSGPAGDEHHNLVTVIQDARGQRDKRQNGIGITEGGPCYTLDGTSEHAVAFALRSDPGGIGQGHNTNFVAGPLGGSSRSGGFQPNAEQAADGHLLECSPPDADRMRDFTELPEGMDSPRYRALGNAVTQEVAYWIARRIAAWIARRIAALMPCLPEVKLHPVIGLEEK